MTTRKLERSEWQRYFDEVAKRIPTMRVRVSILGDNLGVQPETDDAPLIGVSYDHNDDVLTIDTANVSHRVQSPKEIYVREQGGHSPASRRCRRMERNRSSSSAHFHRCRRLDLG